jgi:enolase
MRMQEYTISKIRATEVIDSRALPTIFAEVVLDGGARGSAISPSGASVGKSEAVELRDGDSSRWSGKGVIRAVKNVNEIIAPALTGKSADVREIDRKMIDLDGSTDKSRLGANSILAVSLANARALASAKKLPLYDLISELSNTKSPLLPLPMVNIISGGLHAGGNLDMQDFLAIPEGAGSFREAMDIVGTIYHGTHSKLKELGFSTLLADEGGFGPNFKKHEEALKLLSQVIDEANLSGKASIGIDVASSHFYKEGKYFLKSENLVFKSEEMVNLLADWCDRYAIVSIEDGCAEDDWEGWRVLTRRLGNRVQLIGDDLFTTNPHLIKKGIENRVANSVLIKLNQIGTLSETLEAIEMCKRNGYAPVVSARSGETEDPFIADLALGTAAGQIKVGSIARSERTAKYNRLLEIESAENFSFAGKDALAPTSSS